MKENVIVKGLIILGLVFVLWLSTFFIQSLARERERNRSEVAEELSKSWAGEQRIAGPVLFYTKKIETKEYKKTKQFNRLPDLLTVTANINTFTRHKGIYKIPVYIANISYDATFKFDKDETFIKNLTDKTVLLGLKISDLKGLKSNMVINVNGKQYPLQKDPDRPDILSARIPVADSMHISFQFSLKGIDEFGIQAAGSDTRVDMSSNWTSPSFSGSFLPEHYTITDSGFTATWRVYELNRSLPKFFNYGLDRVFDKDIMTVRFVSPVNVYRQTHRAIKYSFIVIALTFMVFFFIEQMNKVKIHPVQYLLIGLAMVAFYSLLLALSEQLSFNLSYWIATFMTISLIAVYFGFIQKSRKLGITVFAGLLILYGFIYVLLNLETYALLAGSLGMFVIIAVLMYLSLKIKWYGQE